MTNLSNCGCGGEAECWKGMSQWFVRCQKCLLMTPGFSTGERAASAWNVAMSGPAADAGLVAWAKWCEQQSALSEDEARQRGATIASERSRGQALAYKDVAERLRAALAGGEESKG